MQNVLAFLAYGRGLRLVDQGRYEEADAEFELALSLEPGGFLSLEVAVAETAALREAAISSTSDLAGIASATGETGAGVLAPPSANTIQNLDGIGIGQEEPIGAASTPDSDDDQTVTTDAGSTINTLINVAEGVDPTPTAGTLDLGSADQTQSQATQVTQDTNRDPVQEAQNQETVPGTAEAQIRIVIRRPGGDQ